MLENIKNAIQQEISILCANAAVDELSGDTEAYLQKLTTIAQIAELLGIETEITSITLNLKAEQTAE